jgi:Ubiquitin family
MVSTRQALATQQQVKLEVQHAIDSSSRSMQQTKPESIIVHLPSAKQMTLNVQPFFTIESIKQAVQPQLDWSTGNYRLLYDSNRHLQEGRTLQDYSIKDKAHLHVISVPADSIQVRVKRSDKPDVFVDTTTASSVAELKDLLQDKTGVKAESQVLKLRSLALDDAHILKHYGVTDQTKLELKAAENNATALILPVKHFTKYGNTNSNAKMLPPAVDSRGGVGPLSSGDWLEATLVVSTTASYEFAYSLSSAGKPVEQQVESTSSSQQIQAYNSSGYAPPCVNCSYQYNGRGTSTCGSCGKNSITKVVATVVPTELAIELFDAKGSQQLAAVTLPSTTQATTHSSFSTFKAGGAPIKLSAGSHLVRILVKSGNNVVIESIVVTPV